MCYNMNIQTDFHRMEMKALGDTIFEVTRKTPYPQQEFIMAKFIDLTGQRFGRLTVIEREFIKKIKYPTVFWKCKCDCGGEKITSTHLLRSGQTRSCGCLVGRTHTHGKSNTKLYRRWNQMIERCYKSYSQNYSHYGARGIKVCDEWRDDFQAYWDWCVSQGYEEGCRLTIDRIDNNGDYSPENCRLTTYAVQARNTRKLRSDNTTGYRGAHFNKKNNNWNASIGIMGKIIHLGTFQTAEEAAKAYDRYVTDNNLEHTLNFKGENNG